MQLTQLRSNGSDGKFNVMFILRETEQEKERGRERVRESERMRDRYRAKW